MYIVKNKNPIFTFLYHIAVHHKKSNIYRSLDLMASIFCLCVFQHPHISNSLMWQSLAGCSLKLCVVLIICIGRLLKFKEEFANNIYVVEFERKNIYKNDLLYFQIGLSECFQSQYFSSFWANNWKTEKKIQDKKKP